MWLKSLLCSLLVLVVFASVDASAKTQSIPKVIYGIDNRLDIFESNDHFINELSRSTAAQVMDRNVVVKDDGTFELLGPSYASTGVCKSERFYGQPAVASCSGFLVAPDILVTAGHCVRSLDDCRNSYWVFDYANFDGVQSEYKLSKDQVFRCSEVIERKRESQTENDFAVLKLERAVPGRTPLKFRSAGKVNNDAILTVMGHPSGLPLKITPAAEIRDNSKEVFFVTNADTYGGNSGSAVVDTRTGLVEGILVRGDQDFERSKAGGCLNSVYRNESDGRGEDVTRITIIDSLKKKFRQ